jgi:hypothetical protein
MLQGVYMQTFIIAIIHSFIMCSIPFFTKTGTPREFVLVPTSIELCNNTSLIETKLLRWKNRINFTQHGVHDYLQHTFSDPLYAKEFLTEDLSHPLQFLQFGKESNQKLLYSISTFRLFNNKIKQCPYISADAFNAFLARLPHLLESSIHEKNSSFIKELKDGFKRILYHNFLSRFSFFQDDPEKFFDGVLEEMSKAIEKNNYIEKIIDKEQLRSYIVRFIETGIAKLLWSPYSQKEVWESVKQVAEHCRTLHETGIITEDDLDDLYQSLICRFSDFVALVGTSFELETIKAIIDDLKNNSLHLFCLEEQEQCIETRAQRLEKALEIAEISIRATLSSANN